MRIHWKRNSTICSMASSNRGNQVMHQQPRLNRIHSLVVMLVTSGVAIAWLAALIDWLWLFRLPGFVDGSVFAATTVASAVWLCCAWFLYGGRSAWFWLTFTCTFPVFWQFGVYTTDVFELEIFRAYVARAGLATLFVTGLAWITWHLERVTQSIDSARRQARGFNLQAVLSQEQQESDVKTLNPLDPAAWYYGRKAPRLNQSLSSFISYCLVFFLVCVILSRIQGCTQYYDLPAGGGEQQTIAQVVKIQKIIRKKFIVNPYSAILFNVPEIDEVKLELNEDWLRGRGGSRVCRWYVQREGWFLSTRVFRWRLEPGFWYWRRYEHVDQIY